MRRAGGRERIGPLQREHTIGGKPLGAADWLRRASLRGGLFAVGSDRAVASIDQKETHRAVLEERFPMVKSAGCFTPEKFRIKAE
jgi:hypothetical protein